MGSSQSYEFPEDVIKRVVIVGASFGGHMLANGILDLNDQQIEITFIDKAEHFEFICTNYKSLCDDDKFEYLSELHRTSLGQFHARTALKHKVKFIQGLLVNIDNDKNMIQIENQGK